MVYSHTWLNFLVDDFEKITNLRFKINNIILSIYICNNFFRIQIRFVEFNFQIQIMIFKIKKSFLDNNNNFQHSKSQF
jgi:hypothetical protein